MLQLPLPRDQSSFLLLANHVSPFRGIGSKGALVPRFWLLQRWIMILRLRLLSPRSVCPRLDYLMQADKNAQQHLASKDDVGEEDVA